MYLHDRTKKEWLYIVLLVLAVTEGSVELTEQQQKWVDDAIKEAITELKVSDKHYKGAIDLINQTYKPFVEKSALNIAGEKVIITIYCFLETLIANQQIALPEKSKIAELVDWLAGSIDYNEITKKRLKNGNKIANQWLILLQNLGYFCK